MAWQDIVALVSAHVFRVMTPSGSGTGFLFHESDDRKLIGIATAQHVVREAFLWEQPIRIRHHESGNELLLPLAKRAIFFLEHLDTAAILLAPENLPLPDAPLLLTPEDRFLKIGNEIGWVGFPAVSPGNMCFFLGRVSSYLVEKTEYLVDGVVIHGVSGGPVLTPAPDNQAVIMGVISAYIPNRATGETLPGLAVVSDVIQLQQVIRALKSVDEAKAEEEEHPPSPPPAPSVVT